MEHAPLRPVPSRRAGPVDPATAASATAAALPWLDPEAARALGLVALAHRPRAEVAATLGVDRGELAAMLAAGRKELRRTVVALGGSGWCERAELYISDRIDGELAAREARRLDAHLRNCPRCVEHERRLVQATDALLSGLAPAPPRPTPLPEQAGPAGSDPAPETPSAGAEPALEAPEVELVESGPAETEPLEAEPLEFDPPDAEPAEPELVEVQPPEVERSEPEPVEAEPIEAEPGEAEPIEAEPVGSEPVEAEPGEAEPIEAEPIELRPADAGIAPSETQIAAAAEVIVARRTRGQLAAAVTWTALIAIAVILVLAAIALAAAGVVGAEL